MRRGRKRIITIWWSRAPYKMSDYRRYFVPGGTYFFTIVAYRRLPIFGKSAHVEFLRQAIREVMDDQPFEINAAVILPDHMHFIWTLPQGDDKYSKRIGRMKVKFTKSVRGPMSHSRVASASRKKHRESDVWQRRFWEHTIEDEDEFEACFDYVHYNPVKHGLVTCPHLWKYSSFGQWVKRGSTTANGAAAAMADVPSGWTSRAYKRRPVSHRAGGCRLGIVVGPASP